MKYKFCCFALVMYILSLQINAEEITFQNWETHPQIVEITDIYNEIIEGVKTGKYEIIGAHGELNCKKKDCSSYVYQIRDKRNKRKRNGIARSCGGSDLIVGKQRIFADLTKPIREYYSKYGNIRYRIRAMFGIVVHVYYNQSGVKFWMILRDQKTGKIIQWRKIHRMDRQRQICKFTFN